MPRLASKLPRPDRIGKRYLAYHVEECEHRRVKVVAAQLGWTIDAVLRFALYESLEKLEEMARSDP